MSKTRFGIVGCGTAAVPICQAIASVPETELARVQDLNVDMARDLGERYGVPYTTDLNELLDDPAVDALYIAVPHYLLAGLTKRALQANKHALVEKPVALTLADLEELIALAESKHLALGVNYEMRYASCYPQARELAQAGALGDIIGVKIETLIDKKLSYWLVGYSGRATTAWRGEKDKAGGGVTLMNTSHLLDALWWVTGLNITRVSAERDALVANVGVEDTLSAALRFDNGAIGSLFVGAHTIGAQAQQGFEIYGKLGTLRVPDPYSDKPLQVFLRESVRDIPTNVWHTIPREPVDVFQGVVQAFSIAAQAGQPAPISGHDARRVLQTVLAMYEAADEKEGGGVAMIQEAHSATAEELVGALDALDVPFLRGGVKDETALRISPARLMQGLASAPEARMRSAIIPLLLRHPEFATDAQHAVLQMQGQPREILELFYTAALLLQRKYATRLADIFGAQEPLPDLFSEALGLELSEQIEESLQAVGACHTNLTGLKMNWVGGYEHAARTWLEYIELEVTRKKRPAWQTR